MTRKDQIKILDDKIKANNAQYDLDRMNAEILAYSSGDLPKYEYLTKKDLGNKPDVVEIIKEYNKFVDNIVKVQYYKSEKEPGSVSPNQKKMRRYARDLKDIVDLYNLK